MQAGIEADATCPASGASTSYYVWIEWYPSSEYMITSATWSINPGDMIFIEVWNSDPTTGYAYFHNHSTGQSLLVKLPAPSGTSLLGSSAEWVVERPAVINSSGVVSPTTLTNYIDVPLPFGLAWNYTAKYPRYYFPGVNPPAGKLYVLSMVDDSGRNIISTPYIENAYFVWFKNSGPSYSSLAQSLGSKALSSNSPY